VTYDELLDWASQTLEELEVRDETKAVAYASAFNQGLREDIQTVRTAQDLQEFRIRWLGRSRGIVPLAMQCWLIGGPKDLKPVVGRLLNELRREVERVFTDRKLAIEAQSPVLSPPVDITLPGVRRPLGSRHPVQLVMQEIEEIFRSMGYSVETGPEVETDYYNFEALNFPPDHPARDTQDTFFLAGDGNKLLRTHTSPVQIRTMEKQKPPVRAVVLGKVYRRDAPDASHSFMFHQMECFAVDTNITLCDLKGTLNEFIRRFFGPKVRTRFRPSFFPFTEPSAELDISCLLCGGSGCPVCKRTGWVELLGSGMIDPSLYGFVGYDPEKVSGFAFGTGADRLALMKYGINDIQLLWQGDKRFLRQYR
jgi:phenylalanyl-tRNA synthetase alpha chain